MSLPRREQALLDAIDHEVTGEDPRLSRLFGMFDGLWAGAPLPDGEQQRRGRAGFWAALWDALCAGAWLVPPDLPVPGEAGAGPGPADAAEGHPGQEARGKGRDRRDGR